jgi:hypothetical protein
MQPYMHGNSIIRRDCYRDHWYYDRNN